MEFSQILKTGKINRELQDCHKCQTEKVEQVNRTLNTNFEVRECYPGKLTASSKSEGWKKKINKTEG